MTTRQTDYCTEPAHTLNYIRTTDNVFASRPAFPYQIRLLENEAGEMMVCIEVCPEEWSNKPMVTELWWNEALRGKGIGKRLMVKAKEVALYQKRRPLLWRHNPAIPTPSDSIFINGLN